MKPGVWGLCEGAEFLLAGVNCRDIKPREGQRPSESPRPGPQTPCGGFWGVAVLASQRTWLLEQEQGCWDPRVSVLPASLPLDTTLAWSPPLCWGPLLKSHLLLPTTTCQLLPASPPNLLPLLSPITTQHFIPFSFWFIIYSNHPSRRELPTPESGFCRMLAVMSASARTVPRTE